MDVQKQILLVLLIILLNLFEISIKRETCINAITNDDWKLSSKFRNERSEIRQLSKRKTKVPCSETYEYAGDKPTAYLRGPQGCAYCICSGYMQFLCDESNCPVEDYTE